VLPRSRFALFLFAALAFLAAAPASAQPEKSEGARVIEKCRANDLDKERLCYSAAFDSRLASGGAAGALRLLDSVAALDEDVRRDGHMHAHRIGIAALKSRSEVGPVFASCTPGWQSGCYHGVIQSYFLIAEREGAGVTGESVDALCSDHRGTRADLLFQCTHGLGHGLAMFHRHDLPKALASCDLLARPDEREMCWAGAFMENIVNATHPHGAAPAPSAKAKAPAGHAGHEGHGGHGQHHPPASAAAAFKALDPADLHYPCSKMDGKYLIACYTIQTSAMLHHSRQNVARVAAECGKAPERARETCFLSLGRDVSTLALGDDGKAVRLCTLAEATFRPACHRGVVESIINMNASPAEGIPYCRAVPDRAGKLACYTAVGLQATGLPNGQALRDQACKAAEADMVEQCLGRPSAAAPAPTES
jgi:hypothetical protein